MNEITKQLADELIDGKRLEIGVPYEDFEEVYKYIESREVQISSYGDIDEAVIERSDVEEFKYDFPKGELKHEELDVSWEVESHGDKSLIVSFGEYGFANVSEIWLNSVSMLGLVIDSGHRVSSDECENMLEKVREFYNTYEGKKFVIKEK